MKNKMIGTFLTAFLIVSTATISVAQSSTNYLNAIQEAYKASKTLSFDGDIKYYATIQSNSPSEVAMVRYRRDGNKMHIEIGSQTMIYDGSLNIIVNEDEKTIFLSDRPAQKPSKGLPTEGFDQYVKSDLFETSAENYVGNKRKMSIHSKEKGSSSTIEFIYQPTTNFIEFTRMIIDRDDDVLGADINKKKFECSYYNYKTNLAEKITTVGYVEKVKSGKKATFKGVGKFKNFQIVTI